MPAHMAKKQRQSRAAYLCIALGIGLAVFVIVDPDQRSGVDVRTGAVTSSSVAPTVLGSVVTRASSAPAAEPAAPATFEQLGTVTTRVRSRSTARPTTTTPPPTIGTPWSIENTTTTEGSTTSSSVEDTTTSTDPTTSSETTSTTS